MVVTGAQLFPPSEMKVRITSWDGRDTVADLQKEWTVDKVKIVAMEHFLRPGDSMKTSLYHKLLHVRLSKTLNEGLTLAQEGVKENDELLLLKRRLPPSSFETAERQKEDRRTPDISTIRRMTAHLPKHTYPAKDEEPVNSVDAGLLQFQTELRRILISLIEASQRILCLNPSAAKIFKQAEEMLSEPVSQPKIDRNALKQLTDMGFPEARAKKALVLNKMSVMPAMEWLFQNENDPDVDTPLPELDEPGPSDESEGAQGGTEPSTGEGGLPQYRNILDTIRAFKKREFRPNARALQRLIEMGFPEADATDALRMFRNDQDSACDWLLGDRRERAPVVDEGLDPSSAVYRAIMDNPTVQLGLNNPRCLLAFLQMLENPLAANQWLNDPETGPILMQVSRIYQMRLDADKVASSSSTATTNTITASTPAISAIAVSTATTTTATSSASSSSVDTASTTTGSTAARGPSNSTANSTATTSTTATTTSVGVTASPSRAPAATSVPPLPPPSSSSNPASNRRTSSHSKSPPPKPKSKATPAPRKR